MPLLLKTMSPCKSVGLITFVQLYNHPNMKTRMVKLPCVDSNKIYKVSWPDEDQKKYPPLRLTGSTIMNAGIPIKRDWGDYQAQLIFIEQYP